MVVRRSYLLRFTCKLCCNAQYIRACAICVSAHAPYWFTHTLFGATNNAMAFSGNQHESNYNQRESFSELAEEQREKRLQRRRETNRARSAAETAQQREERLAG